ncbi:MAG: CsgG/HfaB family protein [Bryobacteraceae bacterium]
MRHARPHYAIALVVMLLSVAAVIARAGTPEVVSEAQGMYNDGRFAEAIDLLTKVASDSTLNQAASKDIYLLLAKASAGKNFTDQAVVYMRKVVEIDPTFRLNTKVEPPQVQRVWFKVDSLRSEGDAESKMQTLAVLYFENNSVADREAMDGLSKGLSAMLVTDLMGSPGVRIVERERIQFLLDELKMQKSEYFDQSAAVKVGKLLGAHNLVLGSFSKIDKNTMRIDARWVKTETGEIIKSEKIEGRPSQLAKMQNELSAKVASWMGVEMASAPKDDKQPIEAVLAYTRGLNLEDEMQLTAAYEAYKEALAADPKFDVARDRLLALEPFLSVSGG